MKNLATPDVITSTAPDGSVYQVPQPAELDNQWQEIRSRAQSARERGQKIVAVQGLGFVGVAVAAVVAGATDDAGKPRFFVIGVDRAGRDSYWKIAKINAGMPPMGSPDPQLPQLIAKAAGADHNLTATASEQAYGIADVIVVDLPLDVHDRFVEEATEIDIRLEPFEQAVRAIGREMREDALVILETTVPIGFCRKIVLPILKAERESRGMVQPPLLAHAYERVMPGPKYVDSIRNFWRSFAGIDERSTQAARSFLSAFIHTEQYPLWQLSDPTASEMAKVLENSFRAANIALMYEWTLLAEKIGVNLFEVVDSIRVRKGTHDNMRYPGFGVGGYCLTKDALLAQWSAAKLFDSGVELTMTLEGLKINQRMPLHTFDLTSELGGGNLDGKRLAVLGVSYLPEVPDTRNSPTETLVDALEKVDADFRVHDPYLTFWPERNAVRFEPDLNECLRGAEGVIIAIPHKSYCSLDVSNFVTHQCKFVIDAQNALSDEKAFKLHAAGLRVAGVGKGHWRKKGLHLAQ